MPSFGARSTARLNTCHPDIRRLMQAVVRDRDCTILEGERSAARQAELLRAGKSKTLKSKHVRTPSDAVDAAPYPIPDWSDTDAFVEFGRFVVAKSKDLGIPIRWGGDWDGDGDRSDQTFDDLVHFERIAA